MNIIYKKSGENVICSICREVLIDCGVPGLTMFCEHVFCYADNDTVEFISASKRVSADDIDYIRGRISSGLFWNLPWDERSIEGITVFNVVDVRDESMMIGVVVDGY